MSIQGNDVISPNIIYKQYSQVAPKYKYVRINLSNLQTSTVALSATTSTELQFKLPSNTVMNLSKSVLSASLVVPAQGAGIVSAMVADCYPFGGAVSFETGNGLQILNLPYSSKFSKIVGKTSIKDDELITRDKSSFCYPCNSLINGLVPKTNDGSDDAAVVPYLEPKYHRISGDDESQTVLMQYALGDLRHTAFATDKDLYFEQNDMYVKLTLNGYNDWLFQDTTATNTIAALSTALGASAFTSVYLYIAVEQNPTVIDEVVSQFNESGIKLLIDYPLTTRLTASSTTQNVVIPYVPSNGKTLRKVFHTLWNSTETLSTALDCDNTAHTRVVSYNTYLDSTKLQDDLVATATNDAWRLNMDICKKSAVLNKAVYDRNFFHCDSFENEDMNKDNKLLPRENVVAGLPMDKGLQYQYTATTEDTSLVHLNFAIFTREVLINRNGVQFT